MVGDVNEIDPDSADWDDEDYHHKRMLTKLPNYGITDVAVDFYMNRCLYEHMTCGPIRGNWDDGFGLDNLAGGNLVLNPWYAMCGIDVGDGTRVPGFNPARARGGAGIHLIEPQVPAGAPTFPAPGTRFLQPDSKQSEYAFTKFPEILADFGYTGRINFTDKTDAAINHIKQSARDVAYQQAVRNGAVDPQQEGEDAATAYEGYARGTTDIPDDATENVYNRYLNNPACVHSLRGHPDYSDSSYQLARERFDRFLKLYLSGRADTLPTGARRFFDNFNWQRFGNPADRTRVVADLLSRIYLVQNAPYSIYRGMRGGGLENPTNLPWPEVIKANIQDVEKKRYELVVVRPNIEHNMLGIIMGRGGLDELGATFWGQTELSCYDDSMHGKWCDAMHKCFYLCCHEQKFIRASKKKEND